MKHKKNKIDWEFVNNLRKNGLETYLFFFISFSLWEFLVSVSSRIEGMSTFHPFSILFNISWAALAAFLCLIISKLVGHFTKKNRVSVIPVWIIAVLTFLVYGSQLVYSHIFSGNFYSLVQLGMGTEAMTTFYRETIMGIFECVIFLLIMLLPFVYLIVFHRPSKNTAEPRKGSALLWIAVAVLSFVLGVLVLPLGPKTRPSDPYYIYHTEFDINKSVRRFGPLTSLRLEIRYKLFPPVQSTFSDSSSIADTEISDEDRYKTVEEVKDDGTVVQKKIEYGYNVMDIDFDKIIENENSKSKPDKEIIALSEYFKSRPGTIQNKYTGIYKDYNLILINCESFSRYLVDAERTPILYKMATEGYIFKNYYNTVCDNTSNSEYALNMGLIPDETLLKKGWWDFYNYNSFTACKNNYLPFCLGNEWLKEEGVKAQAFHYYHGTYYGRKDTHPKMGYDFMYAGKGLDNKTQWPTSDLKMMEQSMPHYLAKNEDGSIDKFVVYYLTFSGHMSYNFSSNEMAKKNKNVFPDLPYSTSVKAYIACQQELEFALEYMVEQLEEAGVADKTMIVLVPDHYPYNLKLDKLGELAGKELDPEFGKYESNLYMWCPGGTPDAITVEDPCCTLDVLPTLLNMWGIEYDSRLLAGSDIFSPNRENIAVLSDKSFVTDKVIYNCNSNTYELRTSEQIPDGYIDNCIANVLNKFNLSQVILSKDYYRIAFGK